MSFGGEDKHRKEEGTEVKDGHGSPQALLTQNELYSSHLIRRLQYIIPESRKYQRMVAFYQTFHSISRNHKII